MALYTGRLLMRGGNESDFDPDKMIPREWGVSTDKGIVRICIKPGVCIRMATYEAFEDDMANVEEILKTCQTIQEAVIRINTEVSQNADAVAEYTSQAKQYRDEAKQFRDEAFSTTPDGYAEVVETVAKNTVKIDTVIEKADLGIKETASGEEIHLTDSAEGKAVEFALYGKAKQNTTLGNQLFDANRLMLGSNDTLDISEDGYTITVSGGKNKVYANSYYTFDLDLVRGKTLYTKLESISKTISEANSYPQFVIINADDTQRYFPITDLSLTVTIPEDAKEVRCALYSHNGKNALSETNTAVFKGFIVSFTKVDEWEKYSGGMPSPNPQYPQPIEVSGESYNILENTATSTESNGVTFSVNENDGSVTVNGTASANASYRIALTLKKGKYIASGCPSGGSSETYSMLVQNSDATINLFDIGNGITFNIEEDNTKMWIYPARIAKGTTVNNLTFKPMVRKATVKNERYMPFGVNTVGVKSCGKNLLKTTNSSEERNGIVAIVNDGIVVVNGTATATRAIPFYAVLEKGKYIVSGCPSGGSSSSYTIWNKTNDTNGENLGYDTGKGVTITLEEKTKVCTYVRIAKDCTVNNLVFYPMIRKCDEKGNPIGDDTFEPYKESTAIINGEFAGIKVSVNGNYTDQNGQQWICDEIVKNADGSEEYIQKIWIEEIKECHKMDSRNLLAYLTLSRTPLAHNSANIVGNVLCNHATAEGLEDARRKQYGIVAYGGAILFRNGDIEQTVEAYNNWLLENTLIVAYELAEPIVTPLTAEEIAEIEKLQTFYPVTNISNDFDCGMSVTYYCDSKNYIDKKISELATAIVNNI